jgi:hypothetical protein
VREVDYEQTIRDNPEGAMKALQTLAAASALADSVKNKVFAGHKGSVKFKETDFSKMESILDNMIEGTDVMENFGMEPGALKTYVAGQIWDLASLPAMALAKLSTKVPSKLAKAAIAPTFTASTEVGKKLVDSGITDVLNKSVKASDLGKVPGLKEEVKRLDLQTLFGKPKKGVEALRGKEELQDLGTAANPLKKPVKVTEGILDKTGQKLEKIVADAPKNIKVNRGHIHDRLMSRVRSDNKSVVESGVTDTLKYEQDLLKDLKAFKKKQDVLPPKFVPAPSLISKVDGSKVDEEIQTLEQLLSGMKKDQEYNMSIIAKKAEAEKNAKKLQKDLLGKKDELKGAQAAENAKLAKENELALAEAEDLKKHFAEENSKILKERQKIEAELAELKAQKKLKKNPPKPLNPKEIAKTRKDGEPMSMKTILDRKKFNKKAEAANKKYLEASELPPLKQIEKKIAEIKAKRSELQPMEDDFIEPELKDIPPVAPDEAIEVPEVSELLDPAPPLKDLSGFEEAIATLQNKKNAKKQIESTNKLLESENQKRLGSYAKAQTGPRQIETFEPVESTLEELWQLKQTIQDRINFNRKNPNLIPEEQARLRDILTEVDSEIQLSLRGVRTPEGWADDAYRTANDQYAKQDDLAEIFEARNAADLQGRERGVGARVAKGAADSIFSKGKRIPYEMGRGAADAVDAARGGRFKIGFGTDMQSPYKSILGTEWMTEVPEVWFDKPYIDEGVPEHRGEPQIDTSALGDGWEVVERKPQSVEEDVRSATDIMAPEEKPIEQKMDERLNPGAWKPVFDPYMNDKILNTPIPRDSKRILENPNAAKAKLGQLAPQHLPMLEEAMTQNPDNLGKVLPQVAMMFPQAFEEDEYGMFDGKLPLDPAMKQKFFTDLDNDEAMDSIAKANLAMKAHRGEPLY